MGFCIILLAFVSTRILHIELGKYSNAVPGLAFLLYEILHRGKKVDRKYLRPLYWNLGMIASTVIVLLWHME